MTRDPLIVTLEDSGPASQDGARLDDFLRVLNGVSRAMRLMVEHLGDRQVTRGQPPAWVQEQSQLQIASLQAGSLVAELTHTPLDGKQMRIESYGPRAFEALRNWDGTEDSTLPRTVTDSLYEAVSGLDDQAHVYLGSREQPRRTQIQNGRPPSRAQKGSEQALLSGWLKEVNWDNGTAQLHDYGGDYVRLRFDEALSEEMLRLATQFVEVRGSGRINDNDEWTSVHVQELLATRSHFEPFDLDAFLNDPNPKLFNPDEVVTASEPFDVEEFVRSIREARDA